MVLLRLNELKHKNINKMHNKKGKEIVNISVYILFTLI